MTGDNVWSPSAHPVHRLIQLHDAAAVAYERVRRSALSVPRPPGLTALADCPAMAGPLDEYREVLSAIARMADPVEPAVAEPGDRGLDAAGAVRAAADSLLAYTTDPTPDEAFGGTNRSVERRWRMQDVRSLLFEELARCGECVPDRIGRRCYGPAYGMARSPGDPFAGMPAAAEVLGWVAACAGGGHAKGGAG